MKKVFALLALFVTTTFFCSAQSSERLSSLINSKEISKGQAAYLAATYLELVNENSSDVQAFDALAERSFFKATGSTMDLADDLIKLDQASFICVKASGLKGGIFYSITKSKRYAFKELKAKGILPYEADPKMKVSGADFISIFSDCVEKAGGNK